jgi:hypothetical protein
VKLMGDEAAAQLPAGPPGDLTTPDLVQGVRSLLIVGSRLSPRVEGPSPSETAFFDCLNELEQRGVDVESLVRFGMIGEVMAPLLGQILVRLLVAEDEISFSADDSEVVTQWLNVLGAPSLRDGTSGEQAVRLMNACLQPLTAWVMTTSVARIYVLRPPSQAELTAAKLDAGTDSEELVADYRWLVERFSDPDLSHWQTSSLHREHRWAAGQHEPACPAEVMDECRIDPHTLAAEIARRAVRARPDEPGQAMRGLAVRMMKEARRLLDCGQYSEAAALFQFAAHQTPDDPDAWNNLGFCEIPTNPTSALFQLEKASRLHYSPVSINYHNRIVCHVRLSQVRIARNLADEYFVMHLDEDARAAPATLWQVGEGGGVTPTQADDTRLEVLRQGLSLATDQEDRELWRERIARWESA